MVEERRNAAPVEARRKRCLMVQGLRFIELGPVGTVSL